MSKGGPRKNAGRPMSQVNKRILAYQLLLQKVPVAKVAKRIGSTEEKLVKWMMDGCPLGPVPDVGTEFGSKCLKTSLTDGEDAG
jgi:hypothetical protein